MGSNQSAPVAQEAGNTPEPLPASSESQPKKKKPAPEHLKGAALVEFKCRKKKKAWSDCVGTFYNRFSDGKVQEDEEVDCDAMFDLYKQCFMKGMLKEREKRGLHPPKEGTLLGDFAEEEGIETKSQQ